MRSPRKKKPKTIPFKDNKGRVVRLPANATISDLVKAGITLSMEPKGTPLPDGVFANVR